MTGHRQLADMIDTANAEALRRILSGDPVLVDVLPAGEALKEFAGKTVLHSGPPIDWTRMCEPTRGAALAAAVFEGWVESLDEARQIIESEDLTFRPNHDFDAVGPMTGITTPHLPVLVIENRSFGNRAFCTINEGMGNVMRFGGNDSEVVERLRWMADRLGPALSVAIRQTGGLALKPLVARALTMGDEMHMRNAAATGLFLRAIAAPLADTCSDRELLSRIIRFIATNDMFFLNIAMAMAKATIAAAHGISGSTVVTTMARNGTDFGIKLSSTGNAWFTAPAEPVDGLYFSGFSERDANPDIGDSCIVETVGLGGFAMAASPAVVGFVGAGTLQDAVNYTLEMSEITLGASPEWVLPTMDGMGAPTAIDMRKVVDTGITPVINTAIVHRLSGRGQIGAGLARAPLACFAAALNAFAAGMNVTA